MPKLNATTHPSAVNEALAALPPRDQALAYLEAARSTNVRGELRQAIQAAIDIGRAPRKRQITDLEYEALKPGQKLPDPNRPGFSARCTRRGVRFVYRHKDPETGKQVETHVGYLGETTLADARSTWETLRAQRMEGKQPAVVEEASAPSFPLIKDLVDKFLVQYARKFTRPRSADETDRLLNRHIVPKYGELAADELTHDILAGIFAALDDRPRERDKLRVALSTMFNVAIGRTKKMTMAETWLPRDFPNPVTNVQTAKHTSVAHAPSEGEIKRYATKLREIDLRQDYRDALKLQLLVVGRIREVSDMRWSEVDLDSRTWTLPAERSKNGQQHEVLLSDQALSIVKRRYEWKSPADEFVFPAPANRSRPLRSDLVQKALASKRDELGVAREFSSHAIRHSFTTWAAEQQYPVQVVDRCTNHKFSTGINAKYNHATLRKPAKELWQAWAGYLS